MNEEHIIQQVCNGDVDQFAQLVNRYQTGLIIHCDRLVNNRADAEDLAQTAFLKAYNNLQNYDANKARFSTWLYRIATNVVLDYLRSIKKTVSKADIELLESEDVYTFDEVLLQELRDAVVALMPPEQRRVVEAYYWEGKSYQNIANEMEVPINTVKSWLRRAKLQLRSKIA